VGLGRLFQHPTLDWNLETLKQEAMGGGSSYLARGKLLGGSSSTNATLCHRGTAEDYNSWGLPGWTADDVLPWFVSLEDNPAFGDSKYHGTGTIRLPLEVKSLEFVPFKPIMEQPGFMHCLHVQGRPCTLQRKPLCSCALCGFSIRCFLRSTGCESPHGLARLDSRQ
jgi:hypothetical protein